MCIIGVEVKHEVRKFMLNAVKMVGSPLTFRASALVFRQRCQLSDSFVVHPQRKILDPTKNPEKNPSKNPEKNPTKNPRSAPGND